MEEVEPPNDSHPGRTFLIVILFLLFVIWSNSFHAISYLRQQARVGALDLVTLRFGPVAPFCVVYCLLRRKDLRALCAQHWKSVLLVGALTVPGYNLPLNWGQARVPAATASLLISTNPVFVYVLALAFLGERFQRRKIVGLAVAFLGVYGLLQFQNGRFGETYLLHAVVVLLAPLAWALATVISKPVARHRDPLLFTMASMGIGSLPFFVALLAGSGSTPEVLAVLPRTGWLALVHLSLGCTILGYGVWFWALRHMPASSVAAFVFLNPPLTMLFGIVWGREAFHWSLVVFGIIVLTGVALGSGLLLRRRRAQAPDE